MTEVHGRALEHRFVVRSDDRALSGFLREALVHLLVDDDEPPAQVLDLAWSPDGAQLVLHLDGHARPPGRPASVLAEAMSRINVGATRSVGRDPVLHCGLVERDGRAVVLPGLPGAGKSSTVTALLLRGFGYGSDETGPVTPDGTIRPYPKPVVVGAGSWPSLPGAARAAIGLAGRDLGVWWLDPARLGADVVRRPLPVGAIVAPRYRAGADLEIETLTRGGATAAMASNTFNLEQHGGSGLARIAAITADVPAVSVTFGDVARLCDLVEELVS